MAVVVGLESCVERTDSSLKAVSREILLYHAQVRLRGGGHDRHTARHSYSSNHRTMRETDHVITSHACVALSRVKRSMRTNGRANLKEHINRQHEPNTLCGSLFQPSKNLSKYFQGSIDDVET